MRACSDLRVLCSLFSRVVVSSGGNRVEGFPKSGITASPSPVPREAAYQPFPAVAGSCSCFALSPYSCSRVRS